MRALQRLQARGHEAYLVGGCVRDLLLGRQPKDFDIATAARPTQVKRTFPRNCRIIGRRFKLAHLHFNKNQKILEVATFRTSPTADGDDGSDLLITRDNEFGTAEEDALRRDFTVNALFFDPIADRIIDYAGGLEDVRNRVLCTIGEPIVRFREDPVRIIRAAKFAGRLGFRLEKPTFEAMAEVAPDLSRAAPPRLLEEIQRLLRGGHSLESFQILRDIGALRVVLPVVAEFLSEAREQERVHFWRTLEALDLKILAGEEIPNPVLLGVLFAAPIRARAQRDRKRSWSSVAESMIGPFAQELRLPRRDAGCLKRICGVQQRFTARGPKRFKVGSFLRDPYFAEALLLFELGCMARGEGIQDLVRWQQMFRDAGGEGPPLEPDEERFADETEDDEATAGGGAGEAEEEAELGAERGAAPAGSDEEPAGTARRRRRRRRRRGDKAEKAERADDAGAPRAPSTAKAPATAADDETREVASARGGKKRRRKKKRGAGVEARPEPAAAGSRRREAKHVGARGGRRARARRPVEVETIEPEAIDLSAFDVELDPRHVPSFGVIVEGAEGKKKKKRVPQAPTGDEDYKPPPPPSFPPEEPPAPPEDEFGDW